MQKSLYLGASMLAVAAATIVPASAADMYRSEAPVSMKDTPVYVPAATWTGFYAGINGGYGWSADTGKVAAHAFDDFTAGPGSVSDVSRQVSALIALEGSPVARSVIIGSEANSYTVLKQIFRGQALAVKPI